MADTSYRNRDGKFSAMGCAIFFFFSAAVALSRTHPCLQRGALGFPVDVTVEAVDGGGAHRTGLLVTAQGVDVPELTGQRRHFIVVADTGREARRVRGAAKRREPELRVAV